MITFSVRVGRFNYAGMFPHGFVSIDDSFTYQRDFEHSCDAVIDAITTYPQAGYISVKAVQNETV